MPTREQLVEIIHIQTVIAQSGRNLGEIMDSVVERAPDLVKADGAVIELAEDDYMVYRAASGLAENYLGLRLKLNHSISGLCVLSGQALRCDDSESDPRVDREACRRLGLRSMIILPLRFEDSTVGVLKVMAKEVAHFSQRDTAILSMICDLVGAAIHHAVHESEDDLFFMATHDQLTGLANRALFMDRLRKEMKQCLRKDLSLGVLIIDMDGLKLINDSHGHQTGTAVIKEFASRASASTRGSDTLARLGGDEFGMILDNIDKRDGLDKAAKRIQSSLKKPFLFKGRHFMLRASVGGAVFPEDSEDLEDLLDLADQRMYMDKRKRKQSQLYQEPGRL